MSNKETNAHESTLHGIHSFIAQPCVKQMAAYDKCNSVVNAANMSMTSSNPDEDLVHTT